MREISKFVGAVVTLLFLSGQVLGQSSWAVKDDGSTTVVSNNGTGNDSYQFTKNALPAYDKDLKIVVKDSGGDVLQEITWDTMTTVTVTIGSGQSIEIQDPQDADNLTGSGTHIQI